MKPDIDLTDPRVQILIDITKQQTLKALEHTHRFENAVIPLFGPIKSILRPEHIGSGVVVCIKDQYFIFSASHVFDSYGKYQIFIGLGNGHKLLPLAGDRFSTKKGNSGTHRDDPIDASVFHIQSDIPTELKDVAILFENIDQSKEDKDNCVHIGSGFRIKRTKKRGNKVFSEREVFPTGEYDDEHYDILNLDKDYHLALGYEDQILIDGAWKTSPSPRGISGGAIFRVHGIPVMPLNQAKKEPKTLLSAITIECRREHAGKPGVLIGTRVGVHLGLIAKYLPRLLE